MSETLQLCPAPNVSLSWGIAISSSKQRHQAIFGLGALFAMVACLNLRVGYLNQLDPKWLYSC